MSEKRKAVERVIERIYKDRLLRTGKLPTGKEALTIEKMVKESAENSDNMANRK